MTDWSAVARRAAFESHRLIGWIYWDPTAIDAYGSLGIPGGVGYYVTSRAGALGLAGPDAVAAAFYSIHPDFVRASFDLLAAAGAGPTDASDALMAAAALRKDRRLSFIISLPSD